MGKQGAARLMGLSLSRLERTPDKREVGGSSPLKPIAFGQCRVKPAVKINRIQGLPQKRGRPASVGV